MASKGTVADHQAAAREGLTMHGWRARLLVEATEHNVDETYYPDAWPERRLKAENDIMSRSVSCYKCNKS